LDTNKQTDKPNLYIDMEIGKDIDHMNVLYMEKGNGSYECIVYKNGKQYGSYEYIVYVNRKGY